MQLGARTIWSFMTAGCTALMRRPTVHSPERSVCDAAEYDAQYELSVNRTPNPRSLHRTSASRRSTLPSPAAGKGDCLRLRQNCSIAPRVALCVKQGAQKQTRHRSKAPDAGSENVQDGHVPSIAAIGMHFRDGYWPRGPWKPPFGCGPRWGPPFGPCCGRRSNRPRSCGRFSPNASFRRSFSVATSRPGLSCNTWTLVCGRPLRREPRSAGRCRPSALRQPTRPPSSKSRPHRPRATP